MSEKQTTKRQISYGRIVGALVIAAGVVWICLPRIIFDTHKFPFWETILNPITLSIGLLSILTGVMIYCRPD